MANFYFALINQEAKTLFLDEIKLRYPTLNLSFSQHLFYTFKSEKTIDFNPYFARLSGVCMGKLQISDLNDHDHWYFSALNPSKNKNDVPYKIFSEVKLVVETSERDLWDCRYLLLPSHMQTAGELSPIHDQASPSRAYLKIAEAFESMDFVVKSGDLCLELGSAPGGASQYLLDLGAKLIGVDPAAMDETILHHKNFKHLKLPFEKLTTDHLPERVHFLACDINLPPTVVMKEMKRILSLCRPDQLMLTLKMNEAKHVKEISYWKKDLLALGFKQVLIKYLPSYRQEICLLAKI